MSDDKRTYQVFADLIAAAKNADGYLPGDLISAIDMRKAVRTAEQHLAKIPMSFDAVAAVELAQLLIKWTETEPGAEIYRLPLFFTKQAYGLAHRTVGSTRREDDNSGGMNSQPEVKK